MSVRGGKRQKCYLCDLPKASWTMLGDFTEPVCRGCVNYEGIDRVEDAIHDSRRLRSIEGHGAGPGLERQAYSIGASAVRQNVAPDSSDIMCGNAMQGAVASSTSLPVTALVASGNAGGGARPSEQGLFDDFPSPVTPYSDDMSNRGYGGAIRMIDMNGGYSGYGHVGGMDYMRHGCHGLYPSESAMANLYGGWRAMKRAMSVDDSWYYPTTRPATSTKRSSSSSDAPTSSTHTSAPPAKRSKPPADSPVALVSAGLLRGRANDASSSQNGTVAASPDSNSRTSVPSSEGEKIISRPEPSPGSSNAGRDAGVTTSTTQADNPTATSSASLPNIAAAATDEQMATTPRASEKEAVPLAPSTPLAMAEKKNEADGVPSTTEKSCDHCGCALHSVQYVQCPSVEKHRYCLFCTFMHIEWCDVGTVSCPSKQRCPHPNSDIPWVFLPNEIDSIRKSVQLTETPAIIG